MSENSKKPLHEASWKNRHESELVRLGNSDPDEALALLEQLSNLGIAIPAEIALHVAVRCRDLAPRPRNKRKRGRPPRSFGDYQLRLTDGKAAIEGRELSGSQGPGELLVPEMPIDQIDQRRVRHDHALGASGGARGVDDVGRMFRKEEGLGRSGFVCGPCPRPIDGT